MRAVAALGLALLASGGLAAEERPGPVCDSTAVVGVARAPVAEAGGCGIARPVAVHFAAGVALDPPPVLACGAARALASWIAHAAQLAAAARAVRITGLAIAGGYECRNRRAAGKLSEHALGRAVDIRALRLEGGRSLAVERDWRAGPLPGLLPEIYRLACGGFTTTLGPGSDVLHRDHMHFDTAARRSPYCR